MLNATAASRSPYLSKTDFTNFRVCAGYSWLLKHQPHLVPEETDPGVIRRLQSGDEVELHARNLYPEGILIDTMDMDEAVTLTESAIASGATTLFQATVWTARGLLARADILTRSGDGWILGEVKSTTSIKSEHIADATFQTIAFIEAGHRIVATQLVHLEKGYRREGEPDPSQMLIADDISSRVSIARPGIERQIVAALDTLQNPNQQGNCLCDMGTRSQRCPTFDLFHPDLPKGSTVYDLGGVSGKKLGEVLARGIIDLVAWPDDIDITTRQRQQIEVLRSGKPQIHARQIQNLLRRLEYPIHFLDYETFQTAVPLFDGCGPWAQVPFQYSLHTVAADGTVQHREFLWTEPHAFPVPTLVERLREDLEPSGSVVVWNQGFEENRNREMAEIIPSAADFLYQANARMIDLMDIVKRGSWVHPDFNGSASIKKVLPVAAPDLSYEALDIGGGALASERWFEVVMGNPNGVSDVERDEVFEALRRYCHLDTYAMVRIWEHLKILVDHHGPESSLTHAPEVNVPA